MIRWLKLRHVVDRCRDWMLMAQLDVPPWPTHQHNKESRIFRINREPPSQ